MIFGIGYVKQYVLHWDGGYIEMLLFNDDPLPLPIFHLGSPRKTDPTKYQISFGKLRKKLFFGGLGGVRFPGPSKVANCHLPYCLPRHVLYGSFFEISPFKLLWAQSQNLLETHFKK
jgi:hypothetical protein